MERTVLFVGIYHNKTYIWPFEKVETYNMYLANLLAIGACFMLSFNLQLNLCKSVTPKKTKTKISMTNGSLMKVESIAECCNTFDLH